MKPIAADEPWNYVEIESVGGEDPLRVSQEANRILIDMQMATSEHESVMERQRESQLAKLEDRLGRRSSGISPAYRERKHRRRKRRGQEASRARSAGPQRPERVTSGADSVLELEARRILSGGLNARQTQQRSEEQTRQEEAAKLQRRIRARSAERTRPVLAFIGLR